ncbi:hypothetical protein ACVCGQ_14745 (plasmid) [Staphylococcus aureus]|uniref:hypothetical protein n=1 Tax=Staphylococcus TaxID=1279 RepID=UPI000452FF72|nr:MULTISPECIES: hypothetical protein [Staphylococcus]EWA83251.1 hypothetical protein U433_02623 [Staphylococcus aureus T69716]EWI19657.1 hypothetical protein U515_02622 [Staphylococcus aureus F23336]MBF2172386.1 hypothetical protein [Staphylococcus epidermidis]HBC4536636.1 hypothetical protein [Staphylococcus aureus]HDE0498631.1 hypothetical protein [Staphylococcus aureus]
MINIDGYQYSDLADLIESFKKTLEPKFEKSNRFKYTDFTISDEKEYKVILKWLLSNGYYIKQFPNVVKKQTPLERFAYDEIKAKIRAIKSYNSGDSIPWADRRALINELDIIKESGDTFFEVEKDLNNTINEIANGRGGLEHQTVDDQLGTLNNCIEYLLKEEGKFKDVPESVFYDFLNNKDIMKYRKDTHIFRHASTEALEEKNKWSNDKKQFYIRLGVIMITAIYNDIYWF